GRAVPPGPPPVGRGQRDDAVAVLAGEAKVGSRQHLVAAIDEVAVPVEARRPRVAPGLTLAVDPQVAREALGLHRVRLPREAPPARLEVLEVAAEAAGPARRGGAAGKI